MYSLTEAFNCVNHQAQTHDSYQGGKGTDKDQEESCGDATNAQSAEPLESRNPPPAANGSRPRATRTDMSDKSDSDAKDPIWLVVAQVVYVMMWPFMNALGAPIRVAGALIVRCGILKDRYHDQPLREICKYTCMWHICFRLSSTGRVSELTVSR